MMPGSIEVDDTEATHDHKSEEGDEVVIDEGIRRWYKSCPCSMSAVYPNPTFAKSS